jgi:penicillin-binding protein 1C
MFEAMAEVNRPDAESGWADFLSAQRVAWKTGTSFGNRDAWSIGVTPQFVVGVWVGNADGEGRSTLTGIGTAAPLLFDLLRLLPHSGWFSKPYDAMKQVSICKQTGFLAGSYCNETEASWIPEMGTHTSLCPYHKRIHINPITFQRVSTDCEANNMEAKNWFVLPPAMEFYYKIYHPTYLVLPDWQQGCEPNESLVNMEFIYPRQSSELYLPLSFNGKKSKCIFELAHRRSNASVFWYLDGHYLGETKGIHQFALQPTIGKHILVALDNSGERIERKFDLLN